MDVGRSPPWLKAAALDATRDRPFLGWRRSPLARRGDRNRAFPASFSAGGGTRTPTRAQAVQPDSFRRRGSSNVGDSDYDFRVPDGGIHRARPPRQGVRHAPRSCNASRGARLRLRPRPVSAFAGEREQADQRKQRREDQRSRANDQSPQRPSLTARAGRIRMVARLPCGAAGVSNPHRAVAVGTTTQEETDAQAVAVQVSGLAGGSRHGGCDGGHDGASGARRRGCRRKDVHGVVQRRMRRRSWRTQHQGRRTAARYAFRDRTRRSRTGPGSRLPQRDVDDHLTSGTHRIVREPRRQRSQGHGCQDRSQQHAPRTGLAEHREACRIPKRSAVPCSG